MLYELSLAKNSLGITKLSIYAHLSAISPMTCTALSASSSVMCIWHAILIRPPPE